jgi:hypothetical protein
MIDFNSNRVRAIVWLKLQVPINMIKANRFSNTTQLFLGTYRSNFIIDKSSPSHELHFINVLNSFFDGWQDVQIRTIIKIVLMSCQYSVSYNVSPLSLSADSFGPRCRNVSQILVVVKIKNQNKTLETSVTRLFLYACLRLWHSHCTWYIRVQISIASRTNLREHYP